jgi:hypothetical protein
MFARLIVRIVCADEAIAHLECNVVASHAGADSQRVRELQLVVQYAPALDTSSR